MIDTRLIAAVHNNAAWCDAVVKTHGGATAFAATHWTNTKASPPFYPNLITLTPDDTAEQTAAIAALAQAGLEPGWGVKDSFAKLDLAPLGFKPLFAAQWLYREAAAPPRAVPQWQRVTNEPKLTAWEDAFTDDGEFLHLFRRALLTDPAIAFFAHWQGQALTAGFIANRHAGVCAITNAFAMPVAGDAVLEGVVATASAFANGDPLVTYTPEEAVPDWLALGFKSIGPLRVWAKR